jgi:hypothetical protein
MEHAIELHAAIEAVALPDARDDVGGNDVAVHRNGKRQLIGPAAHR